MAEVNKEHDECFNDASVLEPRGTVLLAQAPALARGFNDASVLEPRGTWRESRAIGLQRCLGP